MIGYDQIEMSKDEVFKDSCQRMSTQQSNLKGKIGIEEFEALSGSQKVVLSMPFSHLYQDRVLCLFQTSASVARFCLEFTFLSKLELPFWWNIHTIYFLKCLVICQSNLKKIILKKNKLNALFFLIGLKKLIFSYKFSYFHNLST